MSSLNQLILLFAFLASLHSSPVSSDFIVYLASAEGCFLWKGVLFLGLGVIQPTFACVEENYVKTLKEALIQPPLTFFKVIYSIYSLLLP